MEKNVLVLSEYTQKYLGIERHHVCDLFSNGRGNAHLRVRTHTHTHTHTHTQQTYDTLHILNPFSTAKVQEGGPLSLNSAMLDRKSVV